MYKRWGVDMIDLGINLSPDYSEWKEDIVSGDERAEWEKNGDGLKLEKGNLVARLKGSAGDGFHGSVVDAGAGETVTRLTAKSQNPFKVAEVLEAEF